MYIFSMISIPVIMHNTLTHTHTKLTILSGFHHYILSTNDTNPRCFLPVLTWILIQGVTPFFIALGIGMASIFIQTWGLTRMCFVQLSTPTFLQ